MALRRCVHASPLLSGADVIRAARARRRPAAANIPSFLIECLVYNALDDRFDHPT
jgi:hypothetical protein